MPTKYPIILVHGLAAKDQFTLISSWGRIPQFLSKQGFKIYLGNTDAWGSYADNAKILQNTIEKVIKEQNSPKVNIIAHSKGGIDSRYLISKLGYGSKIASLTTISTPHRGSELADLIVESKKLDSPLVKQAIKVLLFIYKESNVDPHQLAHQLTRPQMELFNQENLDSPEVYYQSFSTIMHKETDDLSSLLTYRYIKKITGENDGVVSTWSAKLGKTYELIDGKTRGISHPEIVDIKKIKIAGIDIPSKYLELVTSLERKGF